MMHTALEIMLYGMTGIFAAILVIMAVTYLLKKTDKKNPSEQEA